MSRRRSNLAKAQQQCVDELKAMADRLELLLDGPTLTRGVVSHWFHREPFAEGQVSTMLGIAAKQLREALEAFADCAEEGVKVPE